ncbi:MAG TPA: creatininase family protein [Chloroflexota bacterium]|nr:creatininase family protein [Chloroflexota bacterium]
MDEKVQLELMTPGEIVAARERCPVAYVPVSPLEWHGPHLPLGTDGLTAHYVAVAVARRTGGVVLPPLFVGTETVRPHGDGAGRLGPLGFDAGERIVGMDFPGNSVRSLYYEESVFGIVVRETVRLLKAEPYRLIVLVNGHGAENHKRTLQRIAAEETAPPRVGVILPSPGSGSRPSNMDPGHAERWETSMMMAIAGPHVRLSELPPMGQPLRYRDYGIVNGRAFDGYPTPDFTVPHEADPRLSTREEGEMLLQKGVERIADDVRRTLDELLAASSE